MLPLVVLMLFMGVYPRVFLDRSRASVEAVRTRSCNTAGRWFVSKLWPKSQNRITETRMNLFLAQASVMPIINLGIDRTGSNRLPRCRCRDAGRCVCKSNAALDHRSYFTGWNYRAPASYPIWLWSSMARSSSMLSADDRAR